MDLHALAKAGTTDALLRVLFLQKDKSDFDVNEQNEMGQTPLCVAASAGHLDCVEALLTFGACPNEADVDALAPLHNASFMGHLAIVSLLVNANADIGAADQNAWTPLHYAAQGGNAQIVHVLLMCGARQSPDKQGLSPLEIALKLEHFGVVCGLGW